MGSRVHKSYINLNKTNSNSTWEHSFSGTKLTTVKGRKRPVVVQASEQEAGCCPPTLTQGWESQESRTPKKQFSLKKKKFPKIHILHPTYKGGKKPSKPFVGVPASDYPKRIDIK